MGSDNGSSRDFFYLFLVGSFIYLFIHWYLFKELKNPFPLSYIRKYFYYIVGIDLFVSYLSLNMFPPQSSDSKKQKNINNKKNDTERNKTIMEQNKKFQQMKLKQDQDKQNNMKEMKDNNEQINREENNNNNQNNKEKCVVEKISDNAMNNNINDSNNTDDNKSSVFSNTPSPDDTVSADSLKNDKKSLNVINKKNMNNNDANEETEILVYEGK
jgi:membrane-associated HD superfamily phosphohydrolase